MFYISAFRFFSACIFSSCGHFLYFCSLHTHTLLASQENSYISLRTSKTQHRYSLPQLFRIIPIPRHRMPSFDPKTGHVIESFVIFKSCDLSTSGKLCLSLLRTLRLVHVEKLDKKGNMLRVNNLTLINFFLIKFGSCREDVLCFRLLMFQVFCSLVAFGIRFLISGASRSP